MVLDQGAPLEIGKTRDMFERPAKYQAARLTGCKNFSRIKKTGDFEVYALDWGVSLKIAEKVGENVAIVGVRAHDFAPIWADAMESQENVFEVQLREIIESPFEWNIIFSCTGSKGNVDQGQIWWKTGQEMRADDFSVPPRYLRVDKEKILLLSKSKSGSGDCV